MKYLVSDQETISTLNKLKFGYSLLSLAKDNKLIRDSDKQEVSITGISLVDLAQDFVIYGRKGGTLQFDKGRTLRWDDPKARYFDGKYFIQWHPDFDLINTLLLTFTIEDYPNVTIQDLHDQLAAATTDQQKTTIINQLKLIDWYDPTLILT